ncbi:restriction endonuclease subunit S [Daejeonella sp. JGW-45]|uniref:restriction endonuclease subunit S n=1 Tax=Daejeonella sp. JGW-45 TaxID=3034148 RepID=UPI0023EBC842|nr:restriction endonuclease subunit S [Daejeonella sp. JGW-45]
MNKLNKEKWKKVFYGDYVDHIEVNETNPDKRYTARYVSVEHIETGKFKIENWISEEMPTFSRTFKAGQILFGKRRAYQRKVAIADFAGICSPHIWALEAKKELQQDILPYIMLTDNFYEYVNANSAGTMSVYLKWPQLSKYRFLLPSAEDQKQLVQLFQCIEITIDQTDQQEKDLRSLQKRLVDGLLNREPEFGNLLNARNCDLTTFDEIAECDKKYPEHSKMVERFVGLENIESEDFQIKGFGLISNGTTFTKRFTKGDILFGKRRAYLNKVAIANFDGICSNDILVIRAKSEKMLQGLLPFYISADTFIQHAVSTSAGSLSPRTKWKDLAILEIAVPDLRAQKKILEVFEQLQKTLEQIKTQKQILKHLKQKLLNELLG